MSGSKTHNTVLITGAGKRIGRFLASSMAGRGWRVGVHHNSSGNAARKLVEEIQEQDGKAMAIKADLARPGAAVLLLEECINELGTPNCLINNASMFEPDKVGKLSPELWQQQMMVNLQSPVFLADAFYRKLPADESGNIINIIDQKVWNLNPHYFSYTIAKSALWTATQTMAQEFAPRIRVNAIGPGPVLPNQHQTGEEFAEQCATTPLQQGTSPEEIAECVHFIISAKSMTGQMIALDGGRHLEWNRKSPD
jgi:NAD(P)-dependent dehydrogenase (short-subunit alcohol dehydrogenase family)